MHKVATLKSYIIGFVLAIALTLLSFSLVFIHNSSSHEFFSHFVLRTAIIVLAVLQLFIQMIYFLHLGRESKPKNNFVTFVLTILFVAIVVGGSLWIMANLNYNMMQMPSEQKVQYMHDHI